MLFLAAVVFAPLFGLYYLIRYLFRFFNQRTHNRRVSPEYAELLLSSKFIYYQKLDDKAKTKFLQRLFRFIDNKEFNGSGGLQVTDEMIILISASAIQLTFGLEEYLLDHFSKIFVYPKAYYSKISGQYHKGETNLAGAIALSWSHFTDGYNKPGDKINLGLHEMAHALRFDKFKSQDYDRFFNAYFNKWQVVAEEEYQNTKEKGSVFFRDYGGTNKNEFFAVCVESFFESPSEFKRLHPEIYQHMCILLNQDPLMLQYADPGLQQIRNRKTTIIELKGEPFYVSGTSTKNILSLIFAILVWLGVTGANIKDGLNADLILIALLALGVGYGIVIRAFSRVYFYEDGVEIRSFLPNLIDRKKLFSYDELICVDLGNDHYDTEHDTLRMIYLYKGKIKTRTFNDQFTQLKVMRFADKLRSKKVAVKLNKVHLASLT